MSLPVDGYRGIYSFLVPLGAIVYGLIGMYLAYRILCAFHSKAVSAISINTVILSSSLLWYIAGNVTMSHIYSFTVVTAMIYLTVPLFKSDFFEPTTTRLAGIGFFMSLAVMVRLQNAVFILIPLSALARYAYIASKKEGSVNLRNVIYKIFIFTLSAVVTFMPQMLYWKHITPIGF